MKPGLLFQIVDGGVSLTTHVRFGIDHRLSGNRDAPPILRCRKLAVRLLCILTSAFCLPATIESMIHEILPVGPLQCNCSVIGDESTREAMVIDPCDPPLEGFKDRGWEGHGRRIRSVLDSGATGSLRRGRPQRTPTQSTGPGCSGNDPE
jgi:hypothetical protein